MESDGRFTYRDDVLQELRRHGIVPRPHTDPRRLRAHLNDLYVFQVRELDRMRREAERLMGPQGVETFRRQLLALKGRYALLSLPVEHWARRGA